LNIIVLLLEFEYLGQLIGNIAWLQLLGVLRDVQAEASGSTFHVMARDRLREP
jgi:hypothetical protein